MMKLAEEDLVYIGACCLLSRAEWLSLAPERIDQAITDAITVLQRLPKDTHVLTARD